MEGIALDEEISRETLEGESVPFAEGATEAQPLPEAAQEEIEARLPLEEGETPEGEEPVSGEESPSEPKQPWWRELISWLLWLAIPAAVVLLLNAYVIKVVRVSGDSMVPTLHDRDLLLVWQLSEPDAGDIVVFRSGPNYLVKRLIAAEGDAVVIDYLDNAVFVNNRRLVESYINPAEADPMEERGETEYKVPTGYLFVMGDNRNHSSDSRGAVGYVPKENIVGAVVLHIPLGQWLAQLGR